MRFSVLVKSLTLLALLPFAQPAQGAVQAPVLKWKNGGAYSVNFPDTGWYSSPAVADLNGDGHPDVVGSAYSVFALDGRTGALEWRARAGHQVGDTGVNDVGRTWPDVALADLDGDGHTEIVTAHGGGYVSVYDAAGHFMPGWPWHGAGTAEIRALAVADLDHDGKMEIAVGSASGGSNNTYILEANGSVRAGWPQSSAAGNGSAAGIYNNNLALADLNRDGAREVIAPSDVHYICAYSAAAAPLAANSIFGLGHAVWGLVGANVNPAYDLLGYSPSDALDPYRPNFAGSPAAVGDVDGDGTREVVVVGNNYNYTTAPYTDLYCAPYIFNADRTRLKRGAVDWSTPPHVAAPLLTEDYNVIENAAPNPVLADLDGDGRKEILYASYDGMLHCFWLDKTEHGHWPFAAYKPADGFYSFASPPVVADLDNDGKAEVIFATWTQKGSHSYGKLYILDWQGNVLQQVALPTPTDGSDWNGALASPTLANIDDDADLEVVLNTAHNGLVAYDLPGTANARILWGTGRGSFQRTGQVETLTRNAARAWAGYR